MADAIGFGMMAATFIGLVAMLGAALRNSLRGVVAVALVVLALDAVAFVATPDTSQASHRHGTMADAQRVCFPPRLWSADTQRPCVRVLISEDGSALVTMEHQDAALDGGDHRRYALPSACWGWQHGS